MTADYELNRKMNIKFKNDAGLGESLENKASSPEIDQELLREILGNLHNLEIAPQNGDSEKTLQLIQQLNALKESPDSEYITVLVLKLRVLFSRKGMINNKSDAPVKKLKYSEI